MKRLLIATAMVAALAATATAQQPATAPPTPMPPATAAPLIGAPTSPAAPAIGAPVYPAPARPALTYTRSGGYVIGADGLYPYHTGEWLLGGTQGLTSYGGHFTMEFPATPDYGYAPRGSHFGNRTRPGIFRR